MFKTLESSQKKTNEVQKEYCIVFQSKRQTIPSQCLSLSIQGPGSKTNTLHGIFYGILNTMSKDPLPEKF